MQEGLYDWIIDHRICGVIYGCHNLTVVDILILSDFPCADFIEHRQFVKLDPPGPGDLVINNGYKIVCGIKAASRENRIMRFIRTCYYKLIRKMSSTEQIEHFTGFGLYDRSFVEVLRSLNDPTPFLRGIVAELGFARKDIPYEQAKRRAGKTHNNFYTLYDAAMLSFTSYTKIGLRMATFIGLGVAFFSLLVALIYLILTHQ